MLTANTAFIVIWSQVNFRFFDMVTSYMFQFETYLAVHNILTIKSATQVVGVFLCFGPGFDPIYLQTSWPQWPLPSSTWIVAHCRNIADLMSAEWTTDIAVGLLVKVLLPCYFPSKYSLCYINTLLLAGTVYTARPHAGHAVTFWFAQQSWVSTVGQHTLLYLLWYSNQSATAIVNEWIHFAF